MFSIYSYLPSISSAVRKTLPGLAPANPDANKAQTFTRDGYDAVPGQIANAHSAPAWARPKWRVQLRHMDTEVCTPRPLVIKGQLPDDLRGTLYRNGPGSFDTFGTPLNNVLDGDGMVQAITIGEGKAHYLRRFVQTRCRREEQTARARLYGGITAKSPKGMYDIMMDRNVRRPANTNLVVHQKLGALALNESDWPYALNPTTLDTIGAINLGGLLGSGQFFSAHPHNHPNGDMWNIGLQYKPAISGWGMGLKCNLSLYRLGADGHSERRTELTLPYPTAIVHDFAITETKAVVVVSPMVIDKLWSMLLCRITANDAVTWKPELGSKVAVIDLKTGETTWHNTPQPLMVLHTVNAWDDAGGTFIDVCSFPDDKARNFTHEIMESDTPAHVEAQVTRMCIGDNGVAQWDLGGRLDFPRVAPMAGTHKYRYVYGSAWDKTSPLPDLPVRFDTKTGATIKRPLLRPGEYASEGVPVAKANAKDETDVYILTTVTNAEAGTSELRVYDGATPEDDAICVMQLPELVPMAFHGSWAPATAQA